jgi:hypothetical protein
MVSDKTDMKNLIVFSVILLGTILAVEAQNSLTNGLVAYYPFTGNANDASGNGNNGTVYGATLAPDRFGQSNQAYHFNGSSRIFIGNSTLVSGSALTLAAWIKPDSVSSNSMNVISSGTQNSYLLGTATNSTQGSLNKLNSGASSVAVNSAAGVLRTNVWTHLAMVYDGTNCALFVNGVKVASNPASGSLNQDTGIILNIGAYQYVYNNITYNDAFGGFVGAIDEVRIYNRALTDQEIEELAPLASVSIAKAIRLDYQSLLIGTTYQPQTSPDLNTWTNIGSPFTATATTNSQYFDVGNGNAFFRLTVP